MLRSGAGPGDVVALAGRQGWAAAGWRCSVAGSGRRGRWWRPTSGPSRRTPRGCRRAGAGATAMIDVSDGLLADLGHIAEASGVAIDVDTAAFELAEPMQAVGAALGRGPDAVHARRRRRPRDGGDVPRRRPLPDGWTVIGAVAEGAGVTVDGAAYDGPRGHTHFS